MKYLKSAFLNNEDMISLIQKFDFDVESLSIDAYYHPGRIMYQSTLILSLEDDNNYQEIEISSHDLGTLITNFGSKVINKDFSKSLIDIIDDYIVDKNHP